jgi:hypothetical protein
LAPNRHLPWVTFPVPAYETGHEAIHDVYHSISEVTVVSRLGLVETQGALLHSLEKELVTASVGCVETRWPGEVAGAQKKKAPLPDDRWKVIRRRHAPKLVQARGVSPRLLRPAKLRFTF